MSRKAYCSIQTCKNSSRKCNRERQQIRFFSYPADSATRRAWVKKSKQPSKFDTNGKSICSLHFKTSDYEDEMKSQLMNFSPMRLKKDAVPSLYLPGSSLKHSSKREERYSMKLRKKIIRECMEQYKIKGGGKNQRKLTIAAKNNPSEKSALKETELLKKNDTEFETRKLVKDCDCEVSNENCLKCQLLILQEENESLKNEIEVYKQNEKSMKQTIENLQTRRNKLDHTFEGKAKVALNHFLSSNQVDILLKKKTKVRWTEEEFTKAFNILQFSKRFYVYLKDTLNYPLPGFSTLKKWIADISFKIEKNCPVDELADHVLDHTNNHADHSIPSEGHSSKLSKNSENSSSDLSKLNIVNSFADSFTSHSNVQPSDHDPLSEYLPSILDRNSNDLPTNHLYHSETQSTDYAMDSNHQINNNIIQNEIQALYPPTISEAQPLNHLLHSDFRSVEQKLSEKLHFVQHFDNSSLNFEQTKYHATSQDTPSANQLCDHSTVPKSLPLGEDHSNKSLNLGDQQIKIFCSKTPFPSESVINSENTAFKPKSSQTDLKLKENRPVSTTNKSFQFHLSHRNFFNKLILNRIRRKAHKPTKPKRFICTTCNKGFDLSGAFKRHIKTHLLENPWTCDVCDKVFSSKFYLDRHITIHKKDGRFFCDICDQSFVKKINFKDHYLKHKNIQPHKGLDTDANVFSENCPNTKLPSTNYSVNSMPYLCHLCNNTFEAKSDLKSHLVICKEERKNNSKNTKDEKVTYVCESCNKEFKNKQYFQSHLLQHTNQKMFLCQICDKTFSAQHCLKRHMILHDSNENKVQFLCSVCSKVFTQKRYLTQHMQTHLNDKPYACDLCPKKFAQNSTLKKHVESHKNENYPNQSYLLEGALFQ
ncbi:hypothetical protein JTE90_010019 [Oedothorax gibbosus]|uniref:Uncharacterized protein n=1 Tax=Oedothorax gibbosus TaxID=931172 RepID=A0AAV6TYC8_9ARAC|nr:hypothetical protein JTE90_010019 [Oedothorax gibbosus]